MRLPIWIHHFEHYLTANVPPDDASLPVSTFYVKTHDGRSWMPRYDPGLPNGNPSWVDPATGRVHITGPAMIERIHTETYAPQGIGVVPWFVAAGCSRAGSVAAQEAVLAAAAAKAAAAPGEPATGILDLEPANHGPFWRDDLGAGPAEVRAYCERFAANGGGELWVAPDARNPWLGRVSFGEWARQPVVTRVLPRVYWRAFGMQPEAALARALAVLREHGWPHVETVHPILDGDAGPSEMVRAIRYAHDAGCDVSIFQRANLRQDTADAVLALEDPWEADSVEPIDREQILAPLSAIRQEAGRIEQLVDP